MMWNLRELPNKHLLLFSKGPLSLSTVLRREESNEITETDCTPKSRKNVLQLVVINDAFTEATPSLDNRLSRRVLAARHVGIVA